MIKNDKQGIKLLKKNFDLLLQSLKSLKLSIEKVSNFEIKDELTFEEMESYDSLTSKFNRTSDIYTQKVLRTAWSLLHEPFMPFIDFMNKAEKMGLLTDGEKMLEIRDIRNQIAHEYIPEVVMELVGDVIENSNALEENIKITKKFLEERNWM